MAKKCSCLECFSDMFWLMCLLLNVPCSPVHLSQSQRCALNCYPFYAQLTECSCWDVLRFKTRVGFSILQSLNAFCLVVSSSLANTDGLFWQCNFSERSVSVIEQSCLKLFHFLPETFCISLLCQCYSPLLSYFLVVEISHATHFDFLLIS